jgi:hypothetical protein
MNVDLTVGDYVVTIPLDYQGEEPTMGVGSSWFVEGVIVRDDGEEFDEDDFEAFYEEEVGEKVNWKEIFEMANDIFEDQDTRAKFDQYETGLNEQLDED